jgi:phosphatidylserine/phosphatidylglycerophosphate/cardiolipin synthase-like enzyme
LLVSAAAMADAGSPFPSIKIDKLIVMPMESSHSDWVDAIRSARKSIHMEMFHITEKAVINALIARAHDGIDLRVIVDHKETGGYKTALEALIAGGVQVRPASDAFSITHSKTMIIDGEEAWITSINMTNTGTGSRDFGILTPDKGIINEIDQVFEADWRNAENNGDVTPPVSNPNLAWSPVNAAPQIIKLINAAVQSLDVEVENIGLDDVITALNQAAVRGVRVRLIIPECNGNNANNYAALAKTKGVELHVEHDGKSIEQPYLHAKMMVADGRIDYVGSTNLSYNSLIKSRELGVLFTDENIGRQLSNEFATDWQRSTAVQAGAQPNCGNN